MHACYTKVVLLAQEVNDLANQFACWPIHILILTRTCVCVVYTYLKNLLMFTPCSCQFICYSLYQQYLLGRSSIRNHVLAM